MLLTRWPVPPARSTNGTRVCGVFETVGCDPDDPCCPRDLSKIEFHVGECHGAPGELLLCFNSCLVCVWGCSPCLACLARLHPLC